MQGLIEASAEVEHFLKTVTKAETSLTRTVRSINYFHDEFSKGYDLIANNEGNFIE